MGKHLQGNSRIYVHSAKESTRLHIKVCFVDLRPFATLIMMPTLVAMKTKNENYQVMSLINNIAMYVSVTTLLWYLEKLHIETDQSVIMCLLYCKIILLYAYTCNLFILC